MNAAERRMDTAARDFRNIVWPVIGPWLSNGKLITVEGRAGLDDLDLCAGIDALQVLPGGPVRGIANRIQTCDERHRPYRSFTVRRATEYMKRKRDLSSPDRGWLWPGITTQAYITESRELIGAGIINTSHLIHYLDNRPSIVRTNGEDGREFLVAWWDDLAAAGIKIKTCWHPELAGGQQEEPEPDDGLEPNPDWVDWGGDKDIEEIPF